MMKYASVRTHVGFPAANELMPDEGQAIIEFWGRALYSDSWGILNSSCEVGDLPRFAAWAKFWFEDAWSRGGQMARFPLTTYAMEFFSGPDCEGKQLAVVDVLTGKVRMTVDA